MTDSERLTKLEEARRLLLEVEFSYEEGTSTRNMMYLVRVGLFGITKIGWLISCLRDRHLDNVVCGNRRFKASTALKDDPYGGN